MVCLPTELLGAIVEEVHSQSDLLHLRATNTTLNALATPLAFRSIQFSNTDKSLENFKCLTNHPKIAPLIHEVVYQYKEADASTCRQGSPLSATKKKTLRADPCDFLRAYTHARKANPFANSPSEGTTAPLFWKRSPFSRRSPP
jgi:hypothetical protein